MHMVVHTYAGILVCIHMFLCVHGKIRLVQIQLLVESNMNILLYEYYNEEYIYIYQLSEKIAYLEYDFTSC